MLLFGARVRFSSLQTFLCCEPVQFVFSQLGLKYNCDLERSYEFSIACLAMFLDLKIQLLFLTSCPSSGLRVIYNVYMNVEV